MSPLRPWRQDFVHGSAMQKLNYETKRPATRESVREIFNRIGRVYLLVAIPLGFVMLIADFLGTYHPASHAPTTRASAKK